MSKLMKKKGLRTFLVFVGIIVVLVLFFTLKGSSTTDNSDKYAGVDLEAAGDEYGRTDTYSIYERAHGDSMPEGTDNTYDLDVFGYSDNSNVSKRSGVGPDGDKADALQIPEEGYAEFEVDVKQAGYYNMLAEYYPTTDDDDRGISIETKVEINGKVPFSGADAITFQRVYTDAAEPTKDNQGNEIRAAQIQDPDRTWMSSYFEDATGYEVEPYKFYLEEGKNTIRLTGVNEKFVIRKLTVGNKAATPSYEEYAKGNEGKTSNVSSDYLEKIQGETAVRRSAPSLYATYDRSSGDTEYANKESGQITIGNTDKQVLDMTGGTQWKVANDWLEWEMEVPEEGDYVIGIKGRQGYNRGYIANRSLYIDGEIPFEEVSQIRFTYSNLWEMVCLQDENGEAYKFHLAKGKHVIRLKNTLGDLGAYLSELSDSVFNMNKMYRTILVLTGTEPDAYRDYQIEKVYPEVIEAMKIESKRLYKLVDEVTAYAGEKSGEISVAQTLAAQMEKFVDRPDKIPSTLKNFKENVSSLGTSINNLSAASMDIDYIALAGSKDQLPEVNENGFDKVVHECILFVNSFRSDSSALGNVYDSKDKDVIDVWITAGRDQSTILKNMVDQLFTPETGIKVNVKLIDAANQANSTGVNAMLPAVISGFGPDVALCIAQTEPVNYALRNAVVDLTEFAELDDVLSEYYESSYISYKFNGGIYALPETQNYNVMFYRTDIMEDLGIEVEKDVNTWQDVLKILPILQKSSMTFAVPSVERKIGTTTNPDLANYFAQLYQRGGTLYDEEAMCTMIDSPEAIEAFEFYTKLFTNYKLEKQYDFVNRFRSGEMPIGVADYNNFNTLAVFAPEIKGLWNFAMMPGIEQEDGTINRAVQSWGTCSMMLRGAEDRGKKEISWEFLKWWASAETQANFASELEAVMGASARYATANKKTFDTLSWSSKEATALKEQWEHAFGIPEVAGGYYTSRHITNAIRKVMNNNEDPRETILDYVITINDEIRNKRNEFGLPNLPKKN